VYATAMRDPKNLVAEIMKDEGIRKRGKEAVKYAQSLLKRHFLQPVLKQEEELKVLNNLMRSISSEFGSSSDVVLAEESRSEKALRSEPGKPGIEFL
jgi:hypothetical protein